MLELLRAQLQLQLPPPSKASKAPPNPDRQIRVAQAFGFPIRAWYCIGSFIGFISLCHFLTFLYRLRINTSLASRTRVVKPVYSRDVRALRYWRLPAAAMDVFRAVAFRWMVPIGKSHTLNIAELFLTAAYAVIVFLWSLIRSTATTGVKYDPHYWANTAGNVAATQIPLIAALGMKNNVISLLTGVSFNKLNFLHRMTARVLSVLIWVHAAGRIMVGMSGDTAWSEPRIQCGALAATSLSLLSILSIRPLRNSNHELFLAIHFILVFVFLLSSYFHVQILQRLGHFIWPSFLLWGVDRLLRALRLLVFNFGYFKRKPRTELDASVDMLSHDMLRITLHRPKHFCWVPGQSVYLTIAAVSVLPLESHPFTISTIHATPHRAVDDPVKEGKLEEGALHGSKEGFNELVFFVQVKGGFTKRLLRAAESQRGAKMKVLLDGPYGSPPLIRGFATVVLVAGGSGVGFTLPLLLDLVGHGKSTRNVCQKVVFVWAIRDACHIPWISDTLLRVIQNVPPSLTIDVRICITGISKDKSERRLGGDIEVAAKGSSESHNTNSELLNSPAVHVQYQRPDLRQLVKDEIAHASGDIFVCVCGGEGLANGVRFALGDLRPMDILRGGPTVTLYVESFNH